MSCDRNAPEADKPATRPADKLRNTRPSRLRRSFGGTVCGNGEGMRRAGEDQRALQEASVPPAQVENLRHQRRRGPVRFREQATEATNTSCERSQGEGRPAGSGDPALQQRMAFASEGADFKTDSSASVGMTDRPGDRPGACPTGKRQTASQEGLRQQATEGTEKGKMLAGVGTFALQDGVSGSRRVAGRVWRRGRWVRRGG